MNKINSILVAALFSSASLGGAALAGEGSYGQNLQKVTATAPVDSHTTGSIRAGDQDGKLPFNNGGSRDNRMSAVNTGDYYSGANRPN